MDYKRSHAKLDFGNMMPFALVDLAPSDTDPTYVVSMPCKVMYALLIVCPRSFNRLGINRVWLPTLLALSWTGFSRRKHVSRELGSAVPSSATPHSPFPG